MSERAEIGGPTALLHRAVDIRPSEVRVVLLSCAYFFLILSSYYILRPIRDEMGAAGGVDELPWLFTGTLVSMLVAQPLFSGLVARVPRRTFIPATYRFFMLNLVVFFLLLRLMPEAQQVWVGRVFFVWTSVFNLFVVSVFWQFMADLFRTEQGKRVFGFIALGGTIGAITGAGLTAIFVQLVGAVNMLLVSIVLIELGVWCVLALGRHARRPDQEPERGAEAEDADRVIGGSSWAGITHVLRSRYLLGIAAFMLLYTISSTFLYFQQAEIINENFFDTDRRTAVFASIDLAVNVLTLITQAFLTGRIIRWLGIGVTLALLPAISLAGFLALGFAPAVAAFVVFQVMRRASNYALARPTREVLYTVLPREDKFKAKSFIDTFVYRGGDQVGAWSYAGLSAVGMGVAGVSFVAAPLCAIWLVVALWLGRRQAAIRAEQVAAPAVVHR